MTGPAPWFAHRRVVLVNGASSEVATMLDSLPEGTTVWAAHTTTSNFHHPEPGIAELEVALVHPNLRVVPEMEAAPRVTLAEFIQAVLG